MTEHTAEIVSRVASSLRLQVCNPEKLSKEQMTAINEFVEEVGGVDNVRQALAALLKLEKAA